ncbi:dihydrodipicolinate synthase family protein [Azospirillum sp. RWY-5-1]|uniref:Dihydrodipicolinate synthase family protein n=1 Tax=Azospirillum oleiclasticum TaxID=2735135 RepID=A0ABX2TJL6_9PROT|nr:dihydrodipicolinate synthase family protein [Azospirillum oleiclasticum]NYZ14350.1 dihydrodipicolinate synthase family protein [Azospirillum oleiclasticum]NYZ23298.1 dihydrodipicolinate synthase family protein [Azospirillum oleiclasticum]
MTRITGPFVAIVTPFDAEESVNAAALRRQVARQAAVGNGVFCAGTNGEFYALSFEEKVKVAAICVEAAGGRVPVLAHVGEISTHQTIALGKAVQGLGVRAVSAITPSFIACSQDELIDHYRQVADALTVPVYLYNIPARTGNTLQPDTARTLAEHPNIIGIKDSAGSQESLDGFLAIARERSDFDVLVGPDSLVLHGLRHGAAGCISGLGNIAPVTLNGIHASFVRGDLAAAEEHQTRFSTLRKDLYAFGFPPAMVKRALRHAVPDVGASRAPVLIAGEVDARIAALAATYAEAV